jgi:hypothetical protein
LTLDTHHWTALELRGHLDGTTFAISISDPTILGAVRRYPQPAVGVESLLSVGAHALQAVSTGMSVETVRREFAMMVAQIGEDIGTLRAHVDQILRDDGPFAGILGQAREQVRDAVDAAIATQADADTPGSLVARLRAIAAETDLALQTAQTRINAGVRDELDRHAQHHGHLLREMRDLDPNSALGGTLQRIEQAVGALTATVAAAHAAERATAEERGRGTAKGHDYEEFVVATVAEIAGAHQDIWEHTGHQAGLVTAARRQAKGGDVTCTVGENRRVVIEAKDRDATGLSLTALAGELDDAMRNRGARAAIAVLSTPDARFLRGQPLVVVGPTSWAVVLDKEHPDALALKIAYCLARRVAIALTDPRDKLDFGALRQGVEAIGAKLQLLDDVRQQLTNIRNCHDAAVPALERCRREVTQAMANLLGTLDPREKAA